MDVIGEEGQEEVECVGLGAGGKWVWWAGGHGMGWIGVWWSEKMWEKALWGIGGVGWKNGMTWEERWAILR